jgi:hypothetical protein
MKSGAPVDPKIRKVLLDKIESPDTILQLMKIGFNRDAIDELNKNKNSIATQLEAIREENASIKDSEARHSIELAAFFKSIIIPPLAECLFKREASPPVVEAILSSKEKIIEFFKSIPTAYSLFELDFYRNSQKQRKIQPNDLNDIMGLAIAVPYAKLVVTEPFWQNGIKSKKLDSINDITVLTSGDLPNLPNIIEKMP